MITEISVSSSVPNPAAADVSADAPPAAVVLARYGAIPQVARFTAPDADLQRGTYAVAETDRGQEIISILQVIPLQDEQAFTGSILRRADSDDLELAANLSSASNREFSQWSQRIREWKLELELIDLEQTLDRRLILYVLNDRGAETTRLALLAAANGLGIVHVQPVTADGVVTASGGGGCGNCGSH